MPESLRINVPRLVADYYTVTPDPTVPDLCRPEKLSLEYLDIDGNKKYLEAAGFLARAICHEVDHLEGILFKDKVIPEEQLPKEYLEQERKRERRA